MAKSGRVRLADLRRAYRLTHDLRDVGHDPSGWATLAVAGLRKLLGSQIVVLGRIEMAPGRPPRNHLLADTGWESDRHREIFLRRHLVDHDYRGLETFHRFMAGFAGLKTCARERLMGDAEWYRSFEFNEVNRAMNTDDFLPSYGPISNTFDKLGFMNTRPIGDSRYDPSTSRLMHLFHVELRRLLGKSLVLDATRPLAGLPPRLKRTLDCLLEGDSEGQAALRLGLSRHTVHEYVTALYRHFEVGSRRELMALCLRLGSRRAKDSRQRRSSDDR